jgi:hypothetical protein
MGSQAVLEAQISESHDPFPGSVLGASYTPGSLSPPESFCLSLRVGEESDFMSKARFCLSI